MSDCSLSRGLPLTRPYEQREGFDLCGRDCNVAPLTTSSKPLSFPTIYLKFNLVSRFYNSIFIPQFFIVKLVVLTARCKSKPHPQMARCGREKGGGWIRGISIVSFLAHVYLHSFLLLAFSVPLYHTAFCPIPSTVFFLCPGVELNFRFFVSFSILSSPFLCLFLFTSISASHYFLPFMGNKIFTTL